MTCDIVHSTLTMMMMMMGLLPLQGTVESVSFKNVPSFAYKLDASIHVPESLKRLGIGGTMEHNALASLQFLLLYDN